MVYSGRFNPWSCAMFSGEKDHNVILVTKPFTYWTNATSFLDGHCKTLYKMASVQKLKMDASTEKPETTKVVLLENGKESRFCVISVLHCR